MMLGRFKTQLTLLLTGILLLSQTGEAAAAEYLDISYEITYNQTQAREMLVLINNLRTGGEAWVWSEDNTQKTACENLLPLRYDYELEEVAMQRAAEIALSFSHIRPDATSPFSAYSGAPRGENLAGGYETIQDAFEAFCEEGEGYEGQGHRRNMLNASFTSVAIGHAVIGRMHFWVQEFRSSSPSCTPTQAFDGTKTVSAIIRTDRIEHLSPAESAETLLLKPGAPSPLPEASVVLTACEALNGPLTVNVRCSWEISDPETAYIEDGLLYAAALGTTKLTTSPPGTGLQFFIDVRVE